MNTENENIDLIGLIPKIKSGEASPDEILMVKEWISQSPSNRKEYDQFLQLWNATAASENINLDQEWEKMDKYILRTHPKVFYLKRITAIAASLLFLFLLAIYIIRSATTITFKAPDQNKADYFLTDGSKISLNAGSKIILSKKFNVINRELSLDGEAFFEVAKGEKPFVINAHELKVVVTGTEFNVNAAKRNSSVKVTVTEGTVKVIPARDPENMKILTAGEAGAFNRTSGLEETVQLADINDLAWKTGIIHLQKTPLYKAAEIISNTYHIQVKVEPAVKNCSLTVLFENQPADSVLNIVKSTLGLTILRQGRKIVLSGKGC